MKLVMKALCAYLTGILLAGVLVFLPAGTMAFFGGWLFMCVLFVPVLFMGVVLFVKAPALLEKRLNMKEKEKTQKGVVSVSGVLLLAGFIIAGLDFRFSWTAVPFPVQIAAAVLLLAAYGLYAEVMRENAYLSRIVEVQDGQKVIDTGLYGIVRHPMYSATVVLFLSIPLVLGSWIALVPLLVYPGLMVVRILNEEKVLEEGLEGYADYKKRVKWRMIPFVW